MDKRNALRFSTLEERCNPVTSGIGWGYADHLTVSFVPDGTNVSGQASVLHQTLDAVTSTQTWQGEILRAFQTWAQTANMNLGVVADSGHALGSRGQVQGDPRFGDIRISAAPLPMDTIATNTPYLRSGSTWSGDVVLNSNYLFSVGGVNSTVDLYTALLNEAGNVFGVLDTATDTTSATYHQYTGPRAGLNASNIADMQSLYGARPADGLEGSKGNNTIATAIGLDFKKQSVIQAEIASSADVDFYKVAIPTGVASMSVILKSNGNSLLTGSITAYNPSQQIIASAAQTGHNGSDPSLLIATPLAGKTYYVKVAGTGDAAWQTGAYKMRVVFNYTNGTSSFVDQFANATSNELVQYIARELTASGINVSTDQIVKAVVQTGEAHTNDTLASAIDFKSLNIGTATNPRQIGIVQGAISDATDADFYKVKAPKITAGKMRMGAIVWGLAEDGLAPRIDVYTSNLQPANFRVLTNQDGTFSVELADVTSEATYYVRVGAVKTTGSRATGQYNVQITFDTAQAAEFNAYGSGTLTAADPQKGGTITIAQNQLTQFVLASGAASGVSMVRMDILDTSGNLVYSLTGYSDQPAVSGSAYLASGTYQVVFSAVAAPGTTLSATTFSLQGRKLSDPIGPLRINSSSSGTATNDTSIWSGFDSYIGLLPSWTNPYYW